MRFIRMKNELIGVRKEVCGVVSKKFVASRSSFVAILIVNIVHALRKAKVGQERGLRDVKLRELRHNRAFV